MITRIAFDADFVHAARVRGLTLTDVAERAGVTVATASSAVLGRPVNVKTAVRLSRAVAAVPVVPELEAWAREPKRVRTLRPPSRAPASDVIAHPDEQLRMELR